MTVRVSHTLKFFTPKFSRQPRMNGTAAPPRSPRSKAANGETPRRLKVALTELQFAKVERLAQTLGMSLAQALREIIDGTPLK